MRRIAERKRQWRKRREPTPRRLIGGPLARADMIHPLNASSAPNSSTSSTSSALCVTSLYDLSCPPSDLTPAGCSALLCTLLGAVVITVAGNLFIVLSILFFRQLQSRSNVLVASLAVADLLVGLLIMPFSAARTAYNCWFYGDLFCRLHTWLDFSTCTSSIANLACISLERYASIAEPLRYRQMVTPRVLAAMLLLSWSGLPLYGATFMLGWNLVGIKRQVAESSCRHDCRVYMNPASTATNVLVAYVTPMLLMIVANAKIHRLAQAQARRIEGSAMVSGRDDRASTKREHNATRTLGIITGAFILLWMPYFILVASEPLLGYGTSRAAWEVVCWLPYLNSAVNPVLLMVFNRSFNGAFRLALKGRVLKSGCRGIDLFNFRDGNM
ncbi:unnamed protein product [Lampetra planeri]